MSILANRDVINVDSLVEIIEHRLKFVKLHINGEHSYSFNSVHLSDLHDFVKTLELLLKSSNYIIYSSNLSKLANETVYEVAKHIFLNENNSDETLLLDLFELLLKCLQPVDFNQTVVKVVDFFKEYTHLLFDKNGKGINCLKLIASVFNAFANYSFDFVSDDFTFMRDDNFHSFLLNLGFLSNNYTVTKILFSTVIPTLINLTNDASIIGKLKIKLLNEYNIVSPVIDSLLLPKIVSYDFDIEICLSKILPTICTLADYFIPITKDNEFCIITEEKFWSLVYYGLVNSNSYFRKQSMYLAKRAVDYLITNPSLSVEITNFVWNEPYSVELEEIWNNVFIVLEVLDEKQVHLVSPVLPLILKILSNKSIVADGKIVTVLDDCWIFCLCQRVLSHDSNTVIKWGLTNILKSDFFDWSKINKDFIRTVVKTLNNTSLFVNQSKENDLVESELEVSLRYWFIKIVVSEFTVGADKFRKWFFYNLIEVLNEIVWAPVPLFYLFKSLSKVPNAECLSLQSLELLKSFIKEALQTQNVHIRGAIQCLILQCIIQLADLSLLNLQIICDLLSVFRSEECLKRSTTIWNCVIKWLKMFISDTDAVKYVFDSIQSLNNKSVDCNIKGLARFIVILNDANLILKEIGNDNKFHNVSLGNDFDNLFVVFKDCLVRPYINLNIFDNMLSLILNIIIESYSVSGVSDDVIKQDHILSHVPVIESVIKAYGSDIVLFIRQKFNGLNSMDEFDSFSIYFSVLKLFISNPYLLSLLNNDNSITLIISDAYKILNTEEHPLRKYFACKIVSTCCEFNFFQSNFFFKEFYVKHSNLIENLFRHNQINEVLSKNDCAVLNDNITKSDERFWKKIISEYVNCSWTCLYYYFTCCESSGMDVLRNGLVDLKTLLNFGLEAIEIGGKEIVLNVNKVFKIILPVILTSDVVSKNSFVRFISLSWVSCFELRKLDVFWKVYKSWIEMVYQQTILRNDFFRSVLREYINDIFDKSDCISGLCNVLLTHLHEEITEPEIVGSLSDVLIKALVFGPVHRKDLRIEYETSLLIKSYGPIFSINILKPMSSTFRNDLEVRLKALDLIIKSVIANYKKVPENSSDTKLDILSNQKNGIELLTNSIKLLLEFDDSISNKKQRYFNDSLHHRIKNRILQSLLLLQHTVSYIQDEVLSKSACTKGFDEIEALNHVIVEWIFNNLCKESQQPSIRYQLEWLLVRCILRYPELINSFWKMFLKGSEERAGSVCSFISVAYHLAAILNKVSFIEQCIQEILPWCMAQHFSIRLYAQVALMKLFCALDKFNDAELTRPYGVIKTSLLRSLKQGSAVRNAPKLMSDFYFNVFHPIEHFSLKSLYDDLPRLSGLSSDEWISKDDVLSSCFKNTINFKIISLYDNVSGVVNEENVKHVRLTLSQCQSSLLTVKTRGDDSSDQNVESDVTVIQKKFIPWNVMMLDNDIDQDFEECEKFFKLLKLLKRQCNSIDGDSYELSNTKNDFVLVASLIDRPPNLGGICRTCEVFGVKQLILNGLNYINDKQFTSLSMSSEKHVNITEVKQYHLKDYLLNMKRVHNYTLVGAEQTATGIKLHNFQFPAKTLLLLGNEKEGIPATLLPLLDDCVEIPQLGVTRSLNVHVTAAIFVWEYIKQHKYKSVLTS